MMVLGAEFDSVQMVIFRTLTIYKKNPSPNRAYLLYHSLLGGGFSPKKCKDSSAKVDVLPCTNLPFFILISSFPFPFFIFTMDSNNALKLLSRSDKLTYASSISHTCSAFVDALS